jgi:hypothetical protein
MNEIIHPINRRVLRINELASLIESKIPYFDALNPEVSKATVGWHIEHTFLTINTIVNLLLETGLNDYRWKFNFMRIVVFMKRKIPRGKAKSPKAVVPKGDLNLESLKIRLLETKEQIELLGKLREDLFFEHPFLGRLNHRKTVRFLEIHTQHHIDIINDIINFKK